MTFTLPNAYHSVWVVFQVACLLSPVSCLYGNIYLSVSVYIVNVILYFKYKFGLYSLQSPLLKTKPNCFIKASPSCDTLDFLYGMGCQTQLWSAEVKSSPIGPDHTWVWQSMLF